MSTHLYLVSCSKTKAAEPTIARRLYTSDLFKKSFAYAEQEAADNADVNGTPAPIRILSAEHYVLDPWEGPIRRYDHTLHDMPAWQRRAWGVEVAGRLAESYDLPSLTVVALAGAVYVDALAHGIKETMSRVVRIETPLAGLYVGQRLKWLKDHTR